MHVLIKFLVQADTKEEAISKAHSTAMDFSDAGLIDYYCQDAGRWKEEWPEPISSKGNLEEFKKRLSSIELETRKTVQQYFNIGKQNMKAKEFDGIEKMLTTYLDSDPDGLHMEGYYLKTAIAMAMGDTRVVVDTTFYDVERFSSRIPMLTDLDDDPDNWWLVPLDCHH